MMYKNIAVLTISGQSRDQISRDRCLCHVGELGITPALSLELFESVLVFGDDRRMDHTCLSFISGSSHDSSPDLTR